MKETSKYLHLNQINQIDIEIDKIVYELYGLIKKEIEIVENS